MVLYRFGRLGRANCEVGGGDISIELRRNPGNLRARGVVGAGDGPSLELNARRNFLLVLSRVPDPIASPALPSPSASSSSSCRPSSRSLPSPSVFVSFVQVLNERACLGNAMGDARTFNLFMNR